MSSTADAKPQEPPAINQSNPSLHGRYASLVPLEHSHSPALYRHMGGEANAHMWKYVPEPDLPTQASCDERVNMWLSSPVWRTFAMLNGPASDSKSEPAGMVAFRCVDPDRAKVEMGCVMGPSLQRTRAGTEGFFLLLRHAFEDFGTGKVEWKTDTGNAPSVRAAERMGYKSEGVQK